MKKNLVNFPNLFQLVGAIVFILWSMGKVPYGARCWIIPYSVGTILEIIINVLRSITES